MKLHFAVVAALAAACAPFAVACSANTERSAESDGDDVTNDEAVSAAITPGEFKLYDQPRANPNPDCDTHTRLSLTRAYFSVASLEDAIAGSCEIAVVPNPRSYRLRDAGTECGSRIFAGSRRKNGQRYTIKITDNRSRSCDDIVPAQIVVEETDPQGITITKYSHDAAPSEPITVSGDLLQTVGIGGENTGRSIRTADALYELVLDDAERASFEDGKKARVRGRKIFLSGVETSNRPAIDVDDMLVCPNPGLISCRSNGGQDIMLHDCVAENRAWIQSNCPGVNFAD